MDTRFAESLVDRPTPLTSYVCRRLRDYQALGLVPSVDVEALVDQPYGSPGSRHGQGGAADPLVVILVRALIYILSN